jgi:hypothetical protein
MQAELDTCPLRTLVSCLACAFDGLLETVLGHKPRECLWHDDIGRYRPL